MCQKSYHRDNWLSLATNFIFCLLPRIICSSARIVNFKLIVEHDQILIIRIKTYEHAKLDLITR
jgi:hypothetical protein